jgi:hypothetical protein
MNAQRLQAQKTYDAALKAMRATEMGTDLAAHEAACRVLDTARSALVAAEMAHPLPAEIRRENNMLRLRNRGLDF